MWCIFWERISGTEYYTPITPQNKFVLDMWCMNFSVYIFLGFVVIFLEFFWALYEVFYTYRTSPFHYAETEVGGWDRDFEPCSG